MATSATRKVLLSVLLVSILWSLVIIRQANYRFPSTFALSCEQRNFAVESYDDRSFESPSVTAVDIDPLLGSLPKQPPEHQIVRSTASKECFLRTNHTNQWSAARIIIFQRDSGMKLSSLLAHYLQVLDHNSIVIIDHNGRDPLTESLLQQYEKIGVHVWNCTGL